LLQQCHNFKDNGVQNYGGVLFREVQDQANEAFITLPPPKQSGRAMRQMISGGVPQPAKPAVTNMAKFHVRGGGCFDGAGMVHLQVGTKRVSDLRRGDVLFGGARVVCVVRTAVEPGALLVDVGGVKLTPWHPVRVADEWVFPAMLAEQAGSGAFSTTALGGYVFNLVLDRAHLVVINGVECVTLGHGFSDNEVVAHPYYGTRLVLLDLAAMSGWRAGLVTIGGTRHDPVSGLVCGFEEASSLANDHSRCTLDVDACLANAAPVAVAVCAL